MAKTWFITGISRGFGKSLAQAAVQRGDTVIGTVRSGNADIAPGPGKLHVLPLEVTDPAAIEPTIAAAFAITGRVDLLVNMPATACSARSNKRPMRKCCIFSKSMCSGPSV